MDLLLLHPKLSVTLMLTSYIPGSENVLTGFLTDEKFPSPKSQNQETIGEEVGMEVSEN